MCIATGFQKWKYFDHVKIDKQVFFADWVVCNWSFQKMTTEQKVTIKLMLDDATLHLPFEFDVDFGFGLRDGP